VIIISSFCLGVSGSLFPTLITSNDSTPINYLVRTYATTGSKSILGPAVNKRRVGSAPERII
jgi:hypothetical protein